MRVLVTGANGYMGRYVVKSLLAMGADVIATDLKTDDIDIRATVIKADIFSDNMNLFSELGSPEVVIHLAWRDGFTHNAVSHIDYLASHYHFLVNMVERGCRQLVVMGSMHEVGYYVGAIDENSPTNPKSLYGIAKNSLRQALLVGLESKDVVFQWLRGFYIYGDDLKSNSIFGKILVAASQGKTSFPFTSGKNKYDFISCEELGFQIASVALQKEITGIINCCSGKPVSLAEQVESFIGERNLNITLEYGAYPDRPYDSPEVWGDNKKIQMILKKNQ